MPAQDLEFGTGLNDSPFNAALRRMESNAAKSASRITSSLDKAGKPEGHGGEGGHGGGSLGWAVRDFSEGRAGAGLVRLGDSVGVVGNAFIGAITAITVAKSALEKYGEMTKETAEENEKLTDSVTKLAQASTGISKFSGPKKIEETRNSALDQIKSENDQQVKLQSEIDIKNKAPLGGPFGGNSIFGIYAKARDYLTGSESAEDKMKQSQMRRSFAAKELQKADKAKIESKDDENDEALRTSRNSDLRKQVEEGNKIYMQEEEKKRDFQKKSLENDAKLDEENGMEKIRNLRKQIDEGNKLYLEAQEKRHRDSLAQTKEAIGIVEGRMQSAQEAQTSFNRASPDQRRQMNRDYNRELRENRREGRRILNDLLDPDHRTHRDARSGQSRFTRENRFAISNLAELSAALAKELTALSVN